MKLASFLCLLALLHAGAALLRDAPVMNASPCNASDFLNQLFTFNASQATSTLTVSPAGFPRCASVDQCLADEGAFVSTSNECNDSCPLGQRFSFVDSSRKPIPGEGRGYLQTALNTSVCFGVGAELGGVQWEARIEQGFYRFKMVGAWEALCLASGYESDRYPINLQVCPF